MDRLKSPEHVARQYVVSALKAVKIDEGSISALTPLRLSTKRVLIGWTNSPGHNICHCCRPTILSHNHAFQQPLFPSFHKTISCPHPSQPRLHICRFLPQVESPLYSLHRLFSPQSRSDLCSGTPIPVGIPIRGRETHRGLGCSPSP